MINSNQIKVVRKNKLFNTIYKKVDQILCKKKKL